ncbi:MAG: undecaprenyl-phosphate glucose phosphotransferase [Mucilaginibacter sp.]
MNRSSSMGFIFLYTDMLALNTIALLLPSVTGPFHIQSVIFNNLAWLFAYHISTCYARNKQTWTARLIKTTFSAFTLLLLFNWAFYSTIHPYQNINFTIAWILCFGTYLLLFRTAAINARRILSSNNNLSRKIAIIGNNATTGQLLQQLERKASLYTLTGVFDDGNDNTDASEKQLQGNINDCINFCIKNQVREIYTTISPEKDKRIYEIAEMAERNFIQFKLVPDISYYLRMKTQMDQDTELPVLCLTPQPEANISGQIQKRIFDILFSLFVIIFILSWLAPILALLIKLESPGPVFFKQMRTGKNGRPFLCFKFRSLKLNNEADSRQVTANDDRYTRIGKFMRKTNLDELPQFFNVLLGDMSVVGSRPHMLKHTEDFSRLHRHYMLRHYIKPGLTGWAQINGYRGEIKAKEQLIKRVDCDIWYMENWDFWLDMRIVLQTLSSTFKGDKNAY